MEERRGDVTTFFSINGLTFPVPRHSHYSGVIPMVFQHSGRISVVESYLLPKKDKEEDEWTEEREGEPRPSELSVLKRAGTMQ